MRSYQVIRTNTSSYQAPNFPLLEEKMVHSIEGLSYRSLDHMDHEQTVILITNTHTQLRSLPQILLEKAALIVHPNSGYDHFAQEHDLWKNIPLVVGHEVRAQAVAEYSLSSLFQGISEMPQHLSWNFQRNWDRPLLKDLPVWIFGYGHIGKIVAQTLASLGVKITIVDPYMTTPFPTLKKWQEGRLEEARVVIACCSLNQKTQHLFNQDFFDVAHKKLLFINGARGKLVDEKALRNFLQRNPEAFAFLDVFEKEPFGDEWHHFPQVWKTSHIAGVHEKLDASILQFEQKVLTDFLRLDENDFQQKYKMELLQNKWKQGVLI